MSEYPVMVAAEYFHQLEQQQHEHDNDWFMEIFT
jgi:hypothetical protein